MVAVNPDEDRKKKNEELKKKVRMLTMGGKGTGVKAIKAKEESDFDTVS